MPARQAEEELSYVCRSKGKRELRAAKLDFQLFGYCKVGWVEVIQLLVTEEIGRLVIS